MAHLSLITRIGQASDRLTLATLRWRGAVAANYQPTDLLMATVRRAQIDMVLALTPAMVTANLACIGCLIALELTNPRGQYFIFIWASVMMALLTNWISAYRVARSKRALGRGKLASAHSTGVVILSSTAYAMLWSVGMVVVLYHATPQEIAFLGALAAGLVAGGAWVLYSIPLAAISYGLLLLAPVLLTHVIMGNPLWGYYIIVSITFYILLLDSIVRHSTQFIAERIGHEQAAAQRDVISLLMNDIEATGTCWLWRSDAHLRLSHASSGFAAALGLKQSALLGRRLGEVLTECGAHSNDPKSQEALSRITASNGPDLPHFEFRLKIHSPSGGERHLAIYGSRSDIGDASRAPFEGFVRDITEAVRDHEKIQFLATRDALTGLWNAAGFIARAQEEIDRRHGRIRPALGSVADQPFNALTASTRVELHDPDAPMTAMTAMFLYIDADNLKAVNDTYGHRAGDALLVEVARNLTEVAGSSCVIGRKGGDEFQLFGYFVSEAQARNLAQKVCQRLGASFNYDQITIRKSCSIGAVIQSRSTYSIGTLEQWADRALYSAKNKGKARLEYYDEELGAQVFQQRRITADLPAALDRGELTVRFQPIVCIADEKIVGCEALLRWNHADFGPVSPAAIVDAARASGKQTELGDYILERAVTAALDWPGQSYVSVNATAFELNDPDYFKRIVAALERAGCPPERLCIEITESQLLERNRTVLANLLKIRNSGIKLAVDDFGSGYSSLSYLPQYPSNFLKLDRSLLGQDNPVTGRAILRAVATLANELKVLAVAEGVETLTELNMVREAGILLVQGFHYHHPMARNEIASMMATRGARDFEWPF
ncbi:EAL domain-containing protein [Litorivita sp. NS0012-18]|uniref:putative bifunctional diguanylate cyclase/phosphodiesterase n=1 Tax=Litorivita sp. NS0012-18 TaxID=3127655 RepID=UPI003109B999